LFDEPTSGLDPITAAEIGDLINKLKGEREITSVVVTHDIRGARRFADRMVLLHEGRIRAEGRLEELQKSEDELVSRFVDATC
jgi:phospholipid/cholesterol/gamma-HCH transport system ATP-binding protein